MCSYICVFGDNDVLQGSGVIISRIFQSGLTYVDGIEEKSVNIMME